MNVLLVEDDRFSRESLTIMLTQFDYVVRSVASGEEAMREFVRNKPDFLITDWLLPDIDGLSLCRRVRDGESDEYTYIVMVTAKNRKEDMLEAMEAGVDDFISKPFHREELKLRVRNGERILMLQQSLESRIRDLETAQAHVQQLQGFLPICSYCKNVRDDTAYWHKIEHYIAERADQLFFSHSICPDCYKEHVVPMEKTYYRADAPEPDEHSNPGSPAESTQAGSGRTLPAPRTSP